MSLVKEKLAVDRRVWAVEDPRRGKINPYIGYIMEVRWKRPWGRKPAGFTVRGALVWTFCRYGRTLIGEIMTDSGKIISCPWSRNYLEVNVLGPASDEVLGWIAEYRRRRGLPLPPTIRR